ncbi:uncharacterized protein LOC126037129 isoform X2 [Accipiter gentilis]|uniref:uncharacterized protein LOC126037129 isoform X1 n=1 Tax=Astur gentilis TaxID=8957 RepID=UPI0021105850|nr:uncharacterized protein LOC126037129 isoform X1 [Accipiter gentilis]XP_049653323.1 uncharacterized protein LOC126037129 isoform X2 [Accipiter gentilis]
MVPTLGGSNKDPGTPEGLFSGIDTRLLPGVNPEHFDLCVRDRRSQLPAPDSSKKLSSPGSTQDSSQASSQNVLTSAFGTGDPSYLPQTPPRSSLLRDRPKTPPRHHPRMFRPLRSGPEIPSTCPRLLQEALFSGIHPRLLPGVIPERFDLCVWDRRSQLPAPHSSKKLSSPGSTQDSSQASSQNVLTSAFGTGDPSYLPQTPPRSSLLRDRPKTPRQAGEGSLAEASEKEEGLSFRLAGALGFHLSPVFLLFLLELLGYLSRKVKWLKVSWFQLG